jgi:hypothetical protein
MEKEEEEICKLCAINNRGHSGCQYESKVSSEHGPRSDSVNSCKGQKFKGIMFQSVRNVTCLTEEGFSCCTC